MNERIEINEEDDSDDWIEQIKKSSFRQDAGEESLRRKIQESPQSVELWRDEIQAVLAGKRTAQIQKADGAVSTYFRLIIDVSRDPFAARYAFSDALNRVVQEWQPSVLDDGERLYALLSLISSFTPPAGFVKISGFLKTLNWFGKNFTDLLRPKKIVDLHLLALVALSNFFPVPPLNAKEDWAFQIYLSILVRNFSFDGYFGFCAGRLVVLGAKRIDAPDVFGGIEQNPAAMSEIIAALFDWGNQNATEKSLSRLYAYCRSKSLENDFAAAVAGLGGEFVIQPQIKIYGGDVANKLRTYPSPIIVLRNRFFEIAITEGQLPAFIGDRDIEIVSPDLRGWLREPEVMSGQIRDELENIFSQDRDEAGIDEIFKEFKKFGGNFEFDRSERNVLTFSLAGTVIQIELPVTRLAKVQKQLMIFSLEPENKASAVEKIKFYAHHGGKL